jgi:hypothetical protein
MRSPRTFVHQRLGASKKARIRTERLAGHWFAVGALVLWAIRGMHRLDIFGDVIGFSWALWLDYGATAFLIVLVGYFAGLVVARIIIWRYVRDLRRERLRTKQ